jgi:hypothetical protein
LAAPRLRAQAERAGQRDATRSASEKPCPSGDHDRLPGSECVRIVDG